ncbi:hypothetical protein CUJ83_06930, partial [Methanocella sp. CWC-04]|nr:hypothetical protein [Methanocella sp. CWC-04]
RFSFHTQKTTDKLITPPILTNQKHHKNKQQHHNQLNTITTTGLKGSQRTFLKIIIIIKNLVYPRAR